MSFQGEAEEDGCFAIHGLPEGRWRVRAVATLADCEVGGATEAQAGSRVRIRLE
jgi:hypothetical protein